MHQSSTGIAYSLSLLKWDLFTTLTFRDPLPPERAGWALAWRHLHRISDTCGVPYSKLLIALRSEHGELNDRFHFHYLLGRMGVSNVHSACHMVAYDWHKATGGHATVRPYDPRLAGSDYIEEGLGGGNLYELGKYNRSDVLELSRSVVYAVQLAHAPKCSSSGAASAGEKTGGSRFPSCATQVGGAASLKIKSPLPSDRGQPAVAWRQDSTGVYVTV